MPDSPVVFHVLESDRPRDRLNYLIQLLNRLLAEGRQCDLRLRDADAVRQLDRLLWQQPATGFLPHAPADELPQAPIRLWPHDPKPHTERILINLHDDIVADPQAYPHIIELLDHQPDRLERGRQRYRQYRQLLGTPPAYLKVPQPDTE